MKRNLKEFCRRGIVACGFGPLILVVVYLILQYIGAVETLPVNEVCIGIVSLSGLAFIAGGMNVVYQIERLPLMAAISIHGAVLYVSYLLTYLVNDWLDRGMTAVLLFTGIFVGGYLVIWAIIYWIIRRNTRKVNAVLMKQQKSWDMS